MTTTRLNRSQQRQRGFSLLEIMIVVAFIGMLAVLAIPAIIKSRKQAQGRRVVSDARILDAAVDAWAFERNKADGSDIVIAECGGYSKSGTFSTTDILGNAYVIGKVGNRQVQVAPQTKSALSGVGIDWSSF
jgi:prepilin-type N-terminal cleavage/methylation domain-containing protein